MNAVGFVSSPIVSQQEQPVQQIHVRARTRLSSGLLLKMVQYVFDASSAGLIAGLCKYWEETLKKKER